MNRNYANHQLPLCLWTLDTWLWIEFSWRVPINFNCRKYNAYKMTPLCCYITAVPHLLHCHPPPLLATHLLCRSCRSCRRCRGQPWPLGPELTLAAVLCWRWAAYSSSRVQFPCVHSAPGAGLKQILNVYISLQILQEKFLKMYPG